MLVQICRALDGVPLALELAAARAPMLGLAQLVQSLRSRLCILTDNRDRWAPLRQQTLREAYEWSYRLLAEPEQMAFRRLGVLVGSSSLATLQTLASNGSPHPHDSWAALDSLGILVDRSLIVLLPSEESIVPEPLVASPRYRLLESSRLFALEQLQALGELDASRRIHAQRMAIVCDAAWEARWSGEIGIKAWYEALEPDLDDALEAFHWVSTAERTALELALAIRLGRTLLDALPKSQQELRNRIADFCESVPGDGIPADKYAQMWVAICSHGMVSLRWQKAEFASRRALAHSRELAATGGDGRRRAETHFGFILRSVKLPPFRLAATIWKRPSVCWQKWLVLDKRQERISGLRTA